MAAFLTADVPKILALEPDLVLAFSDIQAGIVADLIRAGVAVHAFNQRTITGILDMIGLLSGVVGVPEKGAQLVSDLNRRLDDTRERGRRLAMHPRVYFEEWDEPMIAGIGWVSELIAIAGGEDCFADRAREHAAGARVIADAQDVVARAPDIVLGSWCGKHFRPERVAGRDGWQAIPAVTNGEIHEIKSAVILSPGPVAISEGLPALTALFGAWAARQAV